MGLEIYNEIGGETPFLTAEQMHAGFTMNSTISVRDRNGIGNDPLIVEIKVTDGTVENTYIERQTFYMESGDTYVPVTSSLIVPENDLDYSVATFTLFLLGDSLEDGYNGPETNDIVSESATLFT